MTDIDSQPNTAITLRQEQLKQELANLSKTVMAPTANKISTKGRTFTMPGGATNAGPLKAVILDFIQVNQYYAGAQWNPNQPTPPVCWAVGRTKEDLIASQAAPQRQSPSCETCPKDQFGSGNGKGKACKNQYRLIIVPPDATDETQPYTLYVSPSGMTKFSRYVNDLITHQMHPIEVISLISFDPNAAYPSLQFTFDPKTPKHGNLDVMMQLRARIQPMLLREPEVQTKAA